MQLYSEILLNNLKTVRKEIKPTFDALFIGKENEIRTMIKNPDGTRIGVYRDAEYQEYKYFKNPFAGGEVDLIDSGDLWRGIEIFNEKDGIEIFSTDWKFNKIAEKYGDENFNLTPIETELLIDEIQTLTLELIYKKYVL
jgi:hypothetical protein